MNSGHGLAGACLLQCHWIPQLAEKSNFGVMLDFSFARVAARSSSHGNGLVHHAEVPPHEHKKREQPWDFCHVWHRGYHGGHDFSFITDMTN